MKRDPVIAAEAVETDPAEWLRQELASIPDPAESPSDHARLRGLAAQIPDNAEPTARMLDALADFCQRLHARGDNADMLAMAQRLVRLARELGDAGHLRRALSIRGLASIYCGDPAGAAAALVEALAAAKRTDQPECAGPVWHNLGLVCQCLNQFEAACRCFDLALRLTKGTRYVSDDLSWGGVALCHLHQQEFRHAEATARTALKVSAEVAGERGKFARAGARYVLVCALLALGESERAREYAPQDSESPGVPTTIASIFARLTRAMLVAYGPEPDPGIADLKAVVQLTKECAPAQHPEALAALVQALEANGRADEALVYLHDMLAQTRVRLSEQLSAQLPPEAADLDNDGYATLLASKAATLQVSVARRIGELQKSAVIGSEQAGHDRLRIFRVSRLAELFAMELGWDPDRAARLGFAATVMDAGLAVLPRGLAIKRRGLSVAERRMVHEHVTAGADLLAAARLTVLEPCIPVARFHHERWDGGGPLGLAGEAIPIEARIASLADAFDALTHDRPWRGAMTAAAALRTIAEGAGTQFDPNLAPRFVASVKAMYWDHDKLDDYLAESAAKYDLPYLATRNELDQLIAAGGAA